MVGLLDPAVFSRKPMSCSDFSGNLSWLLSISVIAGCNISFIVGDRLVLVFLRLVCLFSLSVGSLGGIMICSVGSSGWAIGCVDSSVAVEHGLFVVGALFGMVVSSAFGCGVCSSVCCVGAWVLIVSSSVVGEGGRGVGVFYRILDIAWLCVLVHCI